MIKKSALVAFGGSLLLAAALPMAAAAQDEDKTFYWISHGDPADPVWTYFLDGANQWGSDTGNNVNTSFHSNDVALQQEAIRSAIADGANGIVTTSPDPGSLIELTAEANAAGIPIININTPDPTASFDAYVGTNNEIVARPSVNANLVRSFMSLPRGDSRCPTRSRAVRRLHRACRGASRCGHRACAGCRRVPYRAQRRPVRPG